MTNDNALSQLTSLRSEVDALRVQMKDKSREIVRDGTKAVFAEYGDILHSFGWAQYTPYFNDGDPCEFGMAGLWLIAKEDIPDIHEDDLNEIIAEFRVEEGSPAFNRYRNDSKVTERRIQWTTHGNHATREGESRYDDCLGACEQIYSALSTDESAAKDIFGDHVEVIISSAGVEVEEYEHD